MKKTRISIILIIAMTMVACSTSKNIKDTANSNEIVTSEQFEEESEPQVSLEFPYTLDDGNLIVNSIFESSIANPDCNDEDGEDIASIELENQSGQFLSSADIFVDLDDGRTLSFEVKDIPSGMKVWAFETGNIALSEDIKCKSITCRPKYENDIPLMAEQLSIKEEGTTVTICNLTDKSMADIKADFHCLFDKDVYYGGTTYTYLIDIIQAGESISLEVEECYLGEAEAVRITQGNN